MNTSTKPILKSKTIKGSISEIVAVGVLVAGFIGFDIGGETQTDITNNLDKIGIAGFAIWSAINNLIIIWGRITATQPLSKGGAPKLRTPKLPVIIPFLLCISIMTGCAASERQDTVSIKGFNLLVITDIATDNLQPTIGSSGEISGSIPISGVPIPVRGSFQGGGIMAKSNVDIQAASGGTIVIERAISGNLNAPLEGVSERIFKPVDHPFGNITVQGGDAMREHVENLPE